MYDERNSYRSSFLKDLSKNLISPRPRRPDSYRAAPAMGYKTPVRRRNVCDWVLRCISNFNV